VGAVDVGQKSRCDREANLASYLSLYSSAETNALFRNSKRIQRLAQPDLVLDEIIDECFLATLSRLPSAEHRKFCADLLEHDPKTRQTTIENIIWALVNTKEFSIRL
jgi:hypothetical protein